MTELSIVTKKWGTAKGVVWYMAVQQTNDNRPSFVRAFGHTTENEDECHVRQIVLSRVESETPVVSKFPCVRTRTSNSRRSPLQRKMAAGAWATNPLDMRVRNPRFHRPHI